MANDRTDALELATRLDRFVAGNDRALAVLRVPTETEEQKWAHKRQRQQLREQPLTLAAAAHPNMTSKPSAREGLANHMPLSCDFQVTLEPPAGLAKGSNQTLSLRLLREGGWAL